jgi:hypothetical protein
MFHSQSRIGGFYQITFSMGRWIMAATLLARRSRDASCNKGDFLERLEVALLDRLKVTFSEETIALRFNAILAVGRKVSSSMASVVIHSFMETARRITGTHKRGIVATFQSH